MPRRETQITLRRQFTATERQIVFFRAEPRAAAPLEKIRAAQRALDDPDHRRDGRDRLDPAPAGLRGVTPQAQPGTQAVPNAPEAPRDRSPRDPEERTDGLRRCGSGERRQVDPATPSTLKKLEELPPQPIGRPKPQSSVSKRSSTRGKRKRGPSRKPSRRMTRSLRRMRRRRASVGTRSAATQRRGDSGKGTRRLEAELPVPRTTSLGTPTEP
jgi:hypothetical protein